MKQNACPWCLDALDPAFTKQLGKHPEPCPNCQKPVRTSIGQVLFVVACGLPFGAGILFFTKEAFDYGSTLLAATVLILGIILATYALSFLPTIHGPAKGKLS